MVQVAITQTLQSQRSSQENAGAPHAERPREITAVILPEFARRTRGASIANGKRERGGSCRARGVRRWCDAANASAAPAQPWSPGDQENSMTATRR